VEAIRYHRNMQTRSSYIQRLISIAQVSVLEDTSTANMQTLLQCVSSKYRRAVGNVMQMYLLQRLAGLVSYRVSLIAPVLQRRSKCGSQDVFWLTSFTMHRSGCLPQFQYISFVINRYENPPFLSIIFITPIWYYAILRYCINCWCRSR
jgi:hypothetical protein